MRGTPRGPRIPGGCRSRSGAARSPWSSQGDCNGLAADPARALSRKEGDHLGDLLGGDDTARQVLARPFGPDLVLGDAAALCLEPSRALGHLGANPARENGVAGDVERADV